jgi:hypothetical protein
VHLLQKPKFLWRLLDCHSSRSQSFECCHAHCTSASKEQAACMQAGYARSSSTSHQQHWERVCVRGCPIDRVILPSNLHSMHSLQPIDTTHNIINRESRVSGSLVLHMLDLLPPLTATPSSGRFSYLSEVFGMPLSVALCNQL